MHLRTNPRRRVLAGVVCDFDDVRGETAALIDQAKKGHVFTATALYPSDSGDGHDTCHQDTYYRGC